MKASQQNKKAQGCKYFYITTPIFFANAEPHVGHLFTCVIADFFSRFQEQIGNKCIFVTGTDENGQKIQLAAKNNKKNVQAHVDYVSHAFKEIWRLFNINFSAFVRTSSEMHKNVVNSVLNSLHKNSMIVFGKSKTFFCIHCEEYFTNYQAVLSKSECTHCQRKLIVQTSGNYFLKTKQFCPWLQELFSLNNDIIWPKHFVTEISANVLNNDFRDLLIGRKNMGWGVPLAFDPQFEAYVWVDALCSYFSALVQLDNSWSGLHKEVWKSNKYKIILLMGKEIIRFHCVYFLIMLRSLGLNMSHLSMKIHGWLLINNNKISKSKHKNIPLETLADQFGVDTIRFYLLYNHDIFKDYTFDTEQMRAVHNSILVNKIGNVFQRIFILFQQKQVILEQKFQIVKPMITDAQHIEQVLDKFIGHVNQWRFNYAIETIVEHTNNLNKQIDEAHPWTLSTSRELIFFFNKAFLYLKALTWMLKPLITNTYKKIDRLLIFNFESRMNINNIKIQLDQKWEPLFQKLI